MINRVAGLRRMGVQSPGDKPNSGRVPAPSAGEMRAPKLTPTARPVSTYARPEAPQQGNDLLAFANALATISPSLNNYLQEEGSRKQQEMEDLANRRFAGMSFEEAQSAVEAGTIREMENPWFQAAFMKQYGERLAYRRINELTEAYETDFDKVGGNLDEFISSAMKADLDQYGDNRFFVSTYNQLMQNFNARAQAGQAEYKTGLMVNETQGGVFDTFLGMTREMLAEGATPEEVFNAIRGRYGENQQMLHVSFKDQDAELLRVASALAEEGNYEMVQAILRTPRVGEDGTQLGALGDNRDFAADAARITARAQSVQFQNNEDRSFNDRMGFFDLANDGKLNRDDLITWHEENPGALTDAHVQSLIRTNDNVLQQALDLEAREAQRLANLQAARMSEESLDSADWEAAMSGLGGFLTDTTLVNESGSTRDLSAEQRRKRLSEAITSNFQRVVDEGRATPEEAFAAEVDMRIENGMPSEQWKQTLMHGFRAASVFGASGGELPPTVSAGLELYNQLWSTNRRLLASHLDGPAQEFFEAYRINRMYGGDESQAISMAIQRTDDPDRYTSTYAQQRYDDIHRRVTQVDTGFLGMPIFRTHPANAGYVGGEIARIASTMYIDLSPDEAYDQALDRFKEAHTNVNGWWIPTADRNVPEQFGDWAGDLVNTYVQDFPDEGWDAGELTVRPAANGSGAWMIVHGLTGMPVEDASRRYFTLGDLFDHRQAHVQAQQLRLTRSTNARNAARDQGLSPSPARPGFFQNHTGVFRAEFEEGSDEPTFVPLESPQGPQGTWDWTPPSWL